MEWEGRMSGWVMVCVVMVWMRDGSMETPSIQSGAQYPEFGAEEWYPL